QKSATLLAAQVAQVVSVVEDFAGGRTDQAEQQARQCGLTTTAFPDNGGDPRRAFNGEREIVEGDGDALIDQSTAKSFGDFASLEQCGHAASVCVRSSYRWQATHRPVRTSTRRGSSIEQRGIACGQRGWNEQPVGGSSSEGARPGMPRKVPFSSSEGRLAISSCVYGCSGSATTSPTGETSTSRPAY